MLKHASTTIYSLAHYYWQTYDVKNAIGAFKVFCEINEFPFESPIVRRAVEGANCIYSCINRNPRGHEKIEISAIEKFYTNPPIHISKFLVVKYCTILALAFAFMCRANEPSLFNRCDIKPTINGINVYWGVFKNNQDAHEVKLFIAPTNKPSCPVKLVTEYLTLTQHYPLTGPLFYEDHFNKPTATPVTRITTKSMKEALVLVCKHAGVNTKVKLSDIRPTAANNAAFAGASPEEIKALGRWNSDIHLRYIRAVASETSMAERIGL